MNVLHETRIDCPYCGEENTFLVDRTIKEQQYFEDCEVCCRPIDIRVRVSANGDCQVEVHSEDD
ncbi:MAG: CPXCG motif-containing cysteine-rich protein [Xanthomonadales bacterium]|nr:CPXCG motif-containing cysteine-rich protein [Xanthomonadales bacterium]